MPIDSPLKPAPSIDSQTTASHNIKNSPEVSDYKPVWGKFAPRDYAEYLSAYGGQVQRINSNRQTQLAYAIADVLDIPVNRSNIKKVSNKKM